jgi:rare lipoprotein A
MSASARSRSSGRAFDNPREVSYENDPQYQPDVQPISAVSAYAPIDPHGPSEILAGRGLY